MTVIEEAVIEVAKASGICEFLHYRERVYLTFKLLNGTARPLKISGKYVSRAEWAVVLKVRKPKGNIRQKDLWQCGGFKLKIDAQNACKILTDYWPQFKYLKRKPHEAAS
jgi:hypothetical protein